MIDANPHRAAGAPVVAARRLWSTVPLPVAARIIRGAPSVPEPGPPPSAELDPLRSLVDPYGPPGATMTAGEAIARAYREPREAWRLPRGEWARAYRETHAAVAGTLRRRRIEARS